MAKKEKTPRSTYKKIFQYIGKYKGWCFLSILSAIITVLTTLYLPILTGNGIDIIIGVNNVDFLKLTKILIEMIIFIAVTAIFQWIMSVSNNKIAYRITRDIRTDAFNKIEILPLKYLDSHQSGEIVSKVISDVETFADGLLLGFTQLFTGIMTIIVTIIIMFTKNFFISLSVVCLTPISLIVAWLIAKNTYNMFQLQSKTRGEQTAFIDEMITNKKVVQAFGREQEVSNKFKGINENLEKCSLKATFYSSLVNPSTRCINSVIYAIVGVLGGIFAIKGSLTVGGLSSLLLYANKYTKPFNEISEVITEFQNALACATRVFELIDAESQIPDKEDCIKNLSTDGDIQFKDVYFSYSKEQKLIQDFNLEVKSGEKIAIVGPTGCGKTTLINLIMRFYDVDLGSICVEGTDIRDIARKTLRENYGMVLQETWLKAGTIRENIILGNPDATDEEVLNACKLAHAHNFIKRLEKGYDTLIDENGGQLSQGQKQLLCIARVMLCKPPILILDEATSSIDTRTETKIQNAFNELMKGRTSFIVAHRLSTIQTADKILVMNNGNVVEQGNHNELIAQNGFYTKLYNSQFER